eukprot:scaffold467_cov366-Pavlova_lutheri.AAC.19
MDSQGRLYVQAKCHVCTNSRQNTAQTTTIGWKHPNGSVGQRVGRVYDTLSPIRLPPNPWDGAVNLV